MQQLDETSEKVTRGGGCDGGTKLLSRYARRRNAGRDRGHPARRRTRQRHEGSKCRVARRSPRDHESASAPQPHGDERKAVQLYRRVVLVFIRLELGRLRRVLPSAIQRI